MPEYVRQKSKISYSITDDVIRESVCWIEKDSSQMPIVTDIELATEDYEVNVEVLETRVFRMVG